MRCPNQLTRVIQQGDNLYRLARDYRTTVTMILSENPDIDPYNLPVGSSIVICPDSGYNADASKTSPAVRQTLTNDMRMVWEQHIYWTRMLIISIADRLNDLDAVTARIMRNPGDIGSLFAEYYGAETGNAIAQLLTEHLQIGAELVTALRDGKKADADNLNNRWYANADEMADAFSKMNPAYNPEDMRSMLHTHLDLVAQIAAMRLAANYPADIAAFDKSEQEVLRMADYFTSGIVKQFPHRF